MERQNWEGRGYHDKMLSVCLGDSPPATKSDIDEILSGIQELKQLNKRPSHAVAYLDPLFPAVKSNVIWITAGDTFPGLKTPGTGGAPTLSPLTVPRLAVALFCAFAGGALVVWGATAASLTVPERLLVCSMSIPAVGTALAAAMAVAQGTRYDESAE